MNKTRRIITYRVDWTNEGRKEHKYANHCLFKHLALNWTIFINLNTSKSTSKRFTFEWNTSKWMCLFSWITVIAGHWNEISECCVRQTAFFFVFLTRIKSLHALWLLCDRTWGENRVLLLTIFAKLGYVGYKKHWFL